MNRELHDQLRADTEGQVVMEVAKQAGDQVHEIVKAAACSMGTVSAAIGVGLVVVQQLYAETVDFAVKSMDGDAGDEFEIRAAAKQLARDLLNIADFDGDGYQEGEPPTCEGCMKPVQRGQFVHCYDDVGEVHVNCDDPFATTDPSVIDDEAGPVFVLLGSPLMRYRIYPVGQGPTRYAQPCSTHEYIDPNCPDCGKLAE